MNIELKINDATQSLDVAPGETLLDALRAAGYFGVKRGCEAGTCGSCVVLVDGEPMYSCLLFAAAQAGRAITTIEGLSSAAEGDAPHPIVTAFAEAGAVQCGYCVPGMVLTTHALLNRHPDPSDEQVKVAIDGHLCRCTGYVKQFQAIKRAAELVRADRGTHQKETR